jgi:hypothetical protein
VGDTITKSGRFYVCAACTGSGSQSEPSYKQRYGRCEDAPCCGCCGTSGEYGYSVLYSY